MIHPDHHVSIWQPPQAKELLDMAARNQYCKLLNIEVVIRDVGAGRDLADEAFRNSGGSSRQDLSKD